MFVHGNAADCLVSDGCGSAQREIRQSLGMIPETRLGDRCVGADTSVSLHCR
ncbi:hypothetical protein QJS10_CPA08g00621 [Acorus calamus]|uniref:Uncharacterized protein n=1 Tax=Acorus calamus TaxID=4465 RepID=A0AAV9ECJ8_ACOCL|nr:hypothetical protein QJS10_CPA08g00621 [Acorus calamus]